MISENLLGDIFEECIPLFIALGDRTRLTILQCLFETQTTGEGRIPGLNVNEITDRTSLSRPAVSHHLKILKDTGLIDVLRKGVCNYYYLTKCIIGEGSEIYGEVTNSVIGSGVVIEEGAVVKDSIIMQDSVIGKGAVVEKSIIAEDVKVGAGAHLGVGEYAPSKYDQKVYQFDLVTVGEHSVIPENVKIGKNTAISGATAAEDYPNGELESGGYIIKAGGIV